MVDPSRIRITGALLAHRQGLWQALLALGYSPLSAANLLRVTAHLGRWLDAQRRTLKALTDEDIEVFLEARRRDYTHFITRRALAPILAYLEQVGAIRLVASVAAPASAADRLIERYRQYLLRERGLAPGSARAYGDIARRFLQARCAVVSDGALQLTADEVTSFLLEDSSHYSTKTTKYRVTALRSLLRYLYLEARLALDLSGALPAVASRRLGGLPKGLDAAQVQRLLRSCDRRRHSGRRDYAVLLLLVRLGLRRGEVARLELDDIEWRSGALRVRGKGPSDDRLPLPSDVGEALVSYLRRSRPPARARHVFLNLRAPHGPLGPAAIGSIAARALRRSGLPGYNPHRLRHTAATAMLRAGASLDEVAQVLRHRSHDTTAIYAKVDRLTLSTVMRPWPGGAS
jgi:site-specific recombinase XerD